MQQIASCDSADKRGGCTNPAIGKIVRKICCKTCFFVSTCNDNDAAVKTQSGGKEDSCASAVKAGGCTNAKYGHKVRFLCCKGCKKKCGKCNGPDRRRLTEEAAMAPPAVASTGWLQPDIFSTDLVKTTAALVPEALFLYADNARPTASQGLSLGVACIDDHEVG